MERSLLEEIALTFVPNIGPVQAKILLDYFGNARSVFKAKRASLESLEGIGTVRASCIKSFTNFKEAEKEISFIEKYKITPLLLNSEKYPQRLLHCYDPPTLLYYSGNANLNAAKIVAVIGTRTHTEYARQVTDKLMAEMRDLNVLVISGLAFGVDGLAHKAALKNALYTVGVLAHGLDSVYPSQHLGLAKEMLQQGGLLTEFVSNTKPDKHHFPNRNRIVAGMCDALVVVETGIRGGSMITAELANGYNKDVFAYPGRTTDAKSAGCNYLIKNNKAILLTEASELKEIMGWQENKKKKQVVQQQLFVQLSGEEQGIVNFLKERETATIDELNIYSNKSSSAIAAAVLNLELQGIIAALPGKRYRLL